MTGGRLVYSTDGGRVAPEKRIKPRAGAHAAGPAVPQSPDDGWVRLWRMKGGRGGKTVTVVTGLPVGEGQLDALAVELRRFIGAGGGVRDGAVEIQGDHRTRLQQKLTQLGYRVKLAGG
jgi:translation initiation factor 1